jgi:pimeloyl-ACP methyl ester carboxylesterase
LINSYIFDVLLRARTLIRTLFFFLSTLAFSGCSLPAFLVDGRDVAASIAKTHEWKALSFDGEAFVLKGYAKEGPGNDLVVYIEGDGRAWINHRVPSDDPTPKDPLALRLAVMDPAPKVLYLGRPCQYTSPTSMGKCESRFWTTARFSLPVVEAMDMALTQAKNVLKADRLHLIGYSGGGALAVLLASRRMDVATIMTVAGNLDHDKWTHHHQVTPLYDSVNPVNVAASVRNCPQVHFIGSEDEIVPAFVVRSFLDRMGAPSGTRLVEIPKFDHNCCWVKAWPALLAPYRPLSIFVDKCRQKNIK